MEYAFLCHSSDDKELVEHLANQLSSKNVFLDKWNLDAGDLLPSELAKGIVDSKWFVIISAFAHFKDHFPELSQTFHKPQFPYPSTPKSPDVCRLNR